MQLVANPWARIKALKTSDLLPFVQNESVEVSAVIMSKLDVQKAAEIYPSYLVIKPVASAMPYQ